MNIGTMMTILSNSCFNEEGGGNMDINQIIETYLNSLSKEERENTHIERYSFGNTPEMEDELAQLVAEGEKKATTSLLALYEPDNERIPEKGDLNVILDSKGNEVCVTRNIKVYSVPFREVSEKHAFMEGEGDKSLDYWRKVHIKFFKEESEGKFNEDMEVLCEEFELLKL